MMHQGEAAPAPAGTAAAPSGSATICRCCSTTYAQFRQTGLLGCPECYAQFENQLGPLLARAHEGGTHHVGKSPRFSTQPAAAERTGPGPAQRVPAPMAQQPTIDPQQVARAVAERIALLKKRLAEAVAAEQYEKAAKIRDELARVSAPASAQPASPSPSRPRPSPSASHERPGIDRPDSPRTTPGRAGGRAAHEHTQDSIYLRIGQARRRVAARAGGRLGCGGLFTRSLTRNIGPAPPRRRASNGPRSWTSAASGCSPAASPSRCSG